MRMRWGHRASRLAWVIAGWLAGCGPLVLPEGSTETSGSEDEGSTSTTTPPPGTTTAPPPGTTTVPPPSTTVGPTTDDTSTGDEPPMTSVVFLDGNDASS